MPSVADDPLTTLDRKLSLIADRVASVVRGYQTGLYLCGAGGLGKSYEVFRQLEQLECDVRAFNSRMTALGLFISLEKSPDAIHVLEDMERITSDRDAQGVLRSALWAQADRERVVTWTTSNGERRFTFRGGIIMLANRSLADLPELRALASRIPVHKLEITDAEMVAHMRRIASQGWSRNQYKLEPETCSKVCEYVIDECRRTNCPLDLRLFDQSCLDYLQWERSEARVHWKDLVTNHIQQVAAHFRHEVSPRSREETKAYERDIVREICQQTEDAQERERLWEAKTGKRKTSFYNRKHEVEHGGFDR
jgi:hypothetical protein